MDQKLRDRILAWLADNVSPNRLRHILGVEQMCQELAYCHQVNQQQAATAGLMHDLAKLFPPQRLLQMAQAEGIDIDPICQTHPHLLHADVSAIVAREEFEIRDQAILKAIANHTLGSPQMSPLCCIVFVADALEPNRGNTPKLLNMRRVAQKNLYQSVYQTSNYGIKYLLKQHKIIHPRTVSTRNWALTAASSSTLKCINKTELLA